MPMQALTDLHAPGMTAGTKPPRDHSAVDRTAFARRLTYVRETLGLSKKDFAESIGITKSNYSQVEKSERMLTVDQLYRLFMVHGVPMEYLLVGQETRLPEIFRH